LLAVLVFGGDGGESAQPVKKRCWWSSVRYVAADEVAGVDLRLLSGVVLGWGEASEDEGGGGAIASAGDEGMWCDDGLDEPCCCGPTGAKRSATWFATTMAMSYVRARSRRS